MAAPEGNKFWECRAKHGRDGIWASPEDLWNDCVEYFKWVEENPLWESKAFNVQGEVVDHPLPKMRAMTLEGLYIHLGIHHSTWQDYRTKDDFSAIVSRVENVIRDYKFTGAAADLLNANIIARDLGLKESSQHEHSGTVGHDHYIEFVGVED